MIYNPEIECAPRPEMELLQSYRLAKIVRYVWENVPDYRRKMETVGLRPEDIRGVADLSRLPFTVKDDLRRTYPYGLFACKMSDVVRLHASSGTTGKQIVVGYTRRDLEMWADCVARCIVGVGGSKDDFIHVSYGYGLFTGGLGLHDGATALGATVIPASSGNTERQISIIRDFGATILCCTPSYALYIADMLDKQGIGKSELKLKIGIFGAEPWSEGMRREIENRLNIKAYNIYGLSEICGPGVSCDCEMQDGMHIHEDNFIPEIIDPDSGEVLPDGEEGELVITCVTKEAFPLLRYRTRDITSLHHGRCSCGRTLVKMSRITGRSDDMLIIRGVNVFPTQIESVLLNAGHVKPHYLLIADRQNNTDSLEIQVEVSNEVFSDEVRKLESLEKEIARNVQSVLGLTAKITLVEPMTIPRFEGKAKRVIDKRVY